MEQHDALILVTGATGYVGGRLIPRLLQAGYQVRALVRDRERLQGRPWASQVEIVEGDVLQPDTLLRAMAGTRVAYYLVHGTHSRHDVQETDVSAARHFGQAARLAGVQRIVYLGILRQQARAVPPHMGSSQEVGQALRTAGVPVTEFRAAAIVGSGSVLFEMIRNMTERVPIMICPRWTYARLQPIAIRDVLRYLIAALNVPDSSGQVITIGGPDTLTYADMMVGYARARGLRRLLIPVPLSMPHVSALWVHWVTPIPAGIAYPLIEGLRGDITVHDDSAHRLFPDIQPLDYATALLLAVERSEAGEVETSWSDALATSVGDTPVVRLAMEEGIILEQRERIVLAPVESVFKVFSGLGGERGWYYANWTWVLRGVIDRLVGGVGFRRGRRDPDAVYAGEALDFWRVEKVEENRLLRLRAEMKVPGRAWLEFQAEPQPNGRTSLTQRAFFVPKGVPGLLYWYILYPVHSRIFSGLIRAIAQRAERLASLPASSE